MCVREGGSLLLLCTVLAVILVKRAKGKVWCVRSFHVCSLCLHIAGDREDKNGVSAGTEEQREVPGAEDRRVHGQCLDGVEKDKGKVAPAAQSPREPVQQALQERRSDTGCFRTVSWGHTVWVTESNQITEALPLRMTHALFCSGMFG